MQWLSDNIGTVLVALGLALLLGFVLFRLIRNKKAGKPTCSCGCDCKSCPGCAAKKGSDANASAQAAGASGEKKRRTKKPTGAGK